MRVFAAKCMPGVRRTVIGERPPAMHLSSRPASSWPMDWRASPVLPRLLFFVEAPHKPALTPLGDCHILPPHKERGGGSLLHFRRAVTQESNNFNHVAGPAWGALAAPADHEALSASKDAGGRFETLREMSTDRKRGSSALVRRPIAPGKARRPLPPWDPIFPGAFFLRWRLPDAHVNDRENVYSSLPKRSTNGLPPSQLNSITSESVGSLISAVKPDVAGSAYFLGASQRWELALSGSAA